MTETGAPKRGSAVATTKSEAPADSTLGPKVRAAAQDRAKRARADSLLASAKDIKFRIVGNTVDIQALTRFMKVLEASPFIENVQLERSSIILVDGKEVTEFALSAAYQTPDPSTIKTVPVSLSVR